LFSDTWTTWPALNGTCRQPLTRFEVPFMPITTQEPEPVTFELSVMEPAAVVTCTRNVPPVKLAATCGGSGFTPISYCSRSFLILAR